MSGSDHSPGNAPALLEHLFRRQAGRMVSHLTRLLGPTHLELAEDCVQGAILGALQSWPYHGVPPNPSGWLMRAAHNAAIDRIRRHRMMERKALLVASIYESAQSGRDAGWETQLDDDELRMIFMCCHPALPRPARIALSLKTVGGFSVREIARAFLADDAAIAQRLVRAKRQIRESGLTLDLPESAAAAERTDSVLEAVYLIFNEGYQAHEGEDLIRHDLCREALRLGLLISRSPMRTPAADALVALMALQAARLPARTSETGDLILLDDQDRELWDQRLISLGFHHFDRSMEGVDISVYHTQAAIAATHTRTVFERQGKWEIILNLYDQLIALTPSPVARLNRAVAISKVRGAAEALAAIEPLEDETRLRSYHLYLSVRGYLLFELGRRDQAAECFRKALECRCSEPERRFIRRKLEACDNVGG